MAALSINASNVRPSGSATTFIGLLGVDVNAGQPVYLNGVTADYRLANALISNAPSGRLVCSGKAGQNVVICSRDPNFSPGYPINSGNIAILGNVAGQVNDVADRASGWYTHVLGIGIGNNLENFQITGANAALA